MRRPVLSVFLAAPLIPPRLKRCVRTPKRDVKRRASSASLPKSPGSSSLDPGPSSATGDLASKASDPCSANSCLRWQTAGKARIPAKTQRIEPALDGCAPGPRSFSAGERRSGPGHVWVLAGTPSSASRPRAILGWAGKKEPGRDGTGCADHLSHAGRDRGRKFHRSSADAPRFLRE
jgi:hypothetical protein